MVQRCPHSYFSSLSLDFSPYHSVHMIVASAPHDTSAFKARCCSLLRRVGLSQVLCGRPGTGGAVFWLCKKRRRHAKNVNVRCTDAATHTLQSTSCSSTPLLRRAPFLPHAPWKSRTPDLQRVFSVQPVLLPRVSTAAGSSIGAAAGDVDAAQASPSQHTRTGRACGAKEGRPKYKRRRRSGEP